MQQRTIFWILAVLMLATSSPAKAKTFSFPDLDIQCEVPNAWIFRDRYGDLVNVVNRTEDKSFQLKVVNALPGDSLESASYLQRIEAASTVRGYFMTGHEKVSLQGVTFYKVTSSKDDGNRTLYASSYITVGNGYTYIIEARIYGFSPDDDPELQDIVASVKFITPPVPPSASPLGFLLAPPDGLHHNFYFLLYYRIAICVILLGLLAIPLVIILAIGIGLYFLLRKKSSPPTPHP